MKSQKESKIEKRTLKKTNKGVKNQYLKKYDMPKHKKKPNEIRKRK